MARACAGALALAVVAALVCAPPLKGNEAPDIPPRPGPPKDPIAATIARRFAPQLRYNAFVQGGDPSHSNRSESYFPGDVHVFLAQLVAGEGPVVVRPSEGAAPPLVETVRFGDTARFTAARLEGFPEHMAGAPPGEAPTYVHVYEARDARRGPAAEGAGERRMYLVEYWQWYPFDWACARALTGTGCMGHHRGDWEHQVFRVAATLDGAGGIAEARLLAGYYYGHGRCLFVPGPFVETVDDRGAPGGEHPVVYVAQGKHAAYPEAGELHDYAAPRLVSDHDDFFRGNGVWIDAWRAPLVDISKAAVAAAPEAYRPPALEALLVRSDLPLETWLHFRGRWGPDLDGLSTPFGEVYWASSATGPWCKRSFGTYERDHEPYLKWRAEQRTLKLGPVPRAEPIPVPVWKPDGR